MAGPVAALVGVIARLGAFLSKGVRSLGRVTGRNQRTTSSGSRTSIHVSATFRGPLFSDSRTRLIYGAMVKSMQAAALIGENNIKRGYRKSPSRNVVGGRKTGHLSRGIRGKVFSPFKAEISPGKFVYGADVPYAGYVEHGRRASAQVIRPRRAKALRFKPRGSGAFIYRRSTRPFMKPLKGNPMFEKTASSQSFNSTITKVFSKNIQAALS